jgi:hypothetical protein
LGPDLAALSLDKAPAHRQTHARAGRCRRFNATVERQEYPLRSSSRRRDPCPSRIPERPTRP